MEYGRDLAHFIVDEVAPTLIRVRHLAPATTKPDGTILTSADVFAHQALSRKIMDLHPGTKIVSEESDKQPCPGDLDSFWIIDPIDGTRPYKSRNCNEYCISTCLVENSRFIYSLIVIPEGPDHSPIFVEAWPERRTILINGIESKPSKRTLSSLSYTRPKGASLPEDYMLKQIYDSMKVNSTSQTIDLLRCAVDLHPEIPAEFDCFVRRKQWIWDGAPGIAVNIAAGNSAVDQFGKLITPKSYTTNELRIPICIVGNPDSLDRIRETIIRH